jgi:hypothetical protein
MSGLQTWREARRTLMLVFLPGLVGSSALSWYLWGPYGALVCGAAALCLALGFWITETLISAFTRMGSPSPTALSLLFCAKLLWWVTIFLVAKRLPPGFDKPVALGIGTFLLALLAATLPHYGKPGISGPPREP